MRCLLMSSLLFFASLAAHGESVPLQNIDASQFNDVIGDISTDLMHTTVSGAETLGHLYGFEVGLLYGQANSSHLQNIVNQSDPSSPPDVGHLPDAALFGVLTLPLGISGEVGLLPKVGPSDFKISSFSLAAKWTPTEIFGALPLDLAVKASFTASQANFNGTINTIDTTYEYKSRITTLEGYVSKNFIFVEPYFGFGIANAHGELDVSGATTVFAPGFGSTYSASGSRSCGLWKLGAEFKLLFVKLGVEYMNAFDTSRVAGKLSVFF